MNDCKVAMDWSAGKFGGDQLTARAMRSVCTEAHRAGQDHGEQRAVAGIADWLRSVNLLAGKITPAELADRIERDEWRNG